MKPGSFGLHGKQCVTAAHVVVTHVQVVTITRVYRISDLHCHDADLCLTRSLMQALVMQSLRTCVSVCVCAWLLGWLIG